MDAKNISDERFTIADIINLPEGVHMEMIDGEVYDMSAPSPIHQQIVAFFVHKISEHIDNTHKECSVYPAPFGVFLSKDEETYLEPDVSVICDKSKISDRGCEGAPDWIIEVVSPSSKSMDYLRKLHQYRKCGVRLYWIVDPISQCILVHELFSGDQSKHGFDEKIPVSICDGLVIDMKRVCG
ncbi:MAG: Uma2 family endonuclease [Lachnospiraceae bacterium]|nr:Uma2 family endonuclease [Lachnospiraceae bacterium]